MPLNSLFFSVNSPWERLSDQYVYASSVASAGQDRVSTSHGLLHALQHTQVREVLPVRDRSQNNPREMIAG